MSVRIPAIADRRDDLSQLLGDARSRAETALGIRRANVRADFAALYAYTWPGHLDEIDRVMRALIAIRNAGSLRLAAALAGMTKSTLFNVLHTVGIGVLN